MTEVLKWVGIGAAIWFAVAVMVAVFWHRAKKAQPEPPKPSGPRIIGKPTRVEINGVDMTPYLRSEPGEQ